MSVYKLYNDILNQETSLSLQVTEMLIVNRCTFRSIPKVYRINYRKSDSKRNKSIGVVINSIIDVVRNKSIENALNPLSFILNF